MQKKAVAFIPIKLNSQRLPHKNILPLLEKPLCRHILDSLLSVSRLDGVYVYCSDEAVKQYIPSGSIFLKRDKELDGDGVKGFQIYEQFINQVDADIYILAHTTSPFIRSATLQNALNHVLDEDYDSAFTAKKIQTFAWFRGSPINYDLNDVPRTQDMEPVMLETSGFYMFTKELFIKHRRRIGFNPYIQEVDMMEAIDIDTKEDYDLAVMLAERGVGNAK